MADLADIALATLAIVVTVGGGVLALLYDIRGKLGALCERTAQHGRRIDALETRR